MNASAPGRSSAMRLLTVLLQYLRRYFAWYALGAAALCVTNWLSVTIPLYLAHGIDALTQLGRAGLADVRHDALCVAGMGATVVAVRTVSRVCFFTPGRLVEAHVKRELFQRILAQQPPFLSKWSDGDLMSRASSDVTYLRLLSGFSALQVVNTAVAIGLTVVQMIRLSPALTALVAVPLLAAMVLTQLFLRQLYVLMQRLQQQTAELSDHILTSYRGVATIQAFVAEEAFLTSFRAKNRAILVTTLTRVNLWTFLGPSLALAAAVDVCILLYFGGSMAIAGTLSVGKLVAFLTLVAYLTMPLRGTSWLLSLVRQAEAALERLDAVMLPEPERPDGAKPVPVSALPPRIEVRNLTFQYPGTDAPALRDVSFTLEAGATLGVLGPVGSGKTTLLRCLSRLYNPPPGTVVVDGHDVRELDLAQWRRAMTLVPQRAFLFSETLAENVLLGTAPGRLDEVLEAAALKPDLAALPNGIDTPVGEAGVMLSGGQRQRVALARGLLRQCALLLVDDALSAVDHETEQRLIEAIRAPSPKPTTLIVAHRISALAHADLIVVLEAGRCVDQGTHDELIARPGLYRDTWLRQSQEVGQ